MKQAQFLEFVADELNRRLSHGLERRAWDAAVKAKQRKGGLQPRNPVCCANQFRERREPSSHAPRIVKAPIAHSIEDVDAQVGCHAGHGHREYTPPRLADQLEVAAKPLPGGKNPRRLVVVVGPERAVS